MTSLTDLHYLHPEIITDRIQITEVLTEHRVPLEVVDWFFEELDTSEKEPWQPGQELRLL